MKKFKVFFDWFAKIGASILVCIFLVVSHFSILPSILVAQSEVNKQEKFEYQGILELWHVETFEGGSQNRGKFLENFARKFEKAHRGTYIVVLTMNLEQFLLNYSEEKKPNLLSFGAGVGDEIVDDLVELDSTGVRNDLLVGGKIKSRQLAVPYILGGYALISKQSLQDSKSAKTGVGLLGTTNPLNAATKNDIKLDLYNDNKIDSYTAYDKFLKENFDNLLGTQRDVYRVSNRQQNGLLTEYNIYPLSKYTDLVQYISVVKKNKIETELSFEFAKYLIGEEVQKSIKNLSMFSVLDKFSLYDGGIYQQMENSLKETLQVENAFESVSLINSKKEKVYEKFKQS